MAIDRLAFSSFVKAASSFHSADRDTPPDYLAGRVVALAAFPGLVKTASLAVPALEVAGLGALAVPSAKTLRDPNADAHARSHAKYELGGLGVLAAHPLYELGMAAKGKLTGTAARQRLLQRLRV